MQYDIPPKPRRHHRPHSHQHNHGPSVPVHRAANPVGPAATSGHKTFSANFSKTDEYRTTQHPQQTTSTDGVFAATTTIDDHGQAGPEQSDTQVKKTKVSRKLLRRENERLGAEKQQLVEQMNNLELFLGKKNCKLKEQLHAVEAEDEELSKQNVELQRRLQELGQQLLECRDELEASRNCVKCKELGAGLEKVKAENVALRRLNADVTEDMNMLKTVVYRLNVQLERYQEKQTSNAATSAPRPNTAGGSAGASQHPRPDPEVTSNVSNDIIRNIIPESHWDHAHTPISWGRVNAHTLGPLLDAYQDTIQEKEDIIQSYELELGNITVKLKDLMKENEGLYRRLSEDGDCSKVLKQELETMRIEVRAVKEQNDLLIKKCALKQDKLEEVLKCYEGKIEVLKRDYSVMHEQYFHNKADLSALKEKNKTLVDQQDDFKSERNQYIPIAVHNASVSECKRWYEELKIEYDKEKEKLNDSVRQLNQEIVELNNKALNANLEKNTLELSVKDAENNLKTMEAKFLELEQSFSAVQRSRSACKKQLAKAMTFARDLVAEQETLLATLDQRQEENKAARRMGNNIANRMGVLRNQLKAVQKEAWQELTTVEERLLEKERMIHNLRKIHQDEVDKLKSIIKERDSHQKQLPEPTASISLPHLLLLKDRNL